MEEGFFYLGYQGFIQDRQQRVPLRLFQGMSITLKDKISGPFQVRTRYYFCIKNLTIINNNVFVQREYSRILKGDSELTRKKNCF